MSKLRLLAINQNVIENTTMQALQISQLTKTYGNGTQALKGIDLCVEEGDFFALLGPNGAGKSTAIGIISSLVNKTSGQVKVFDCDLDSQRTLVKSHLGLVPQEFNFSQFEKVYDIVVNQAGYYGLPPREANVQAKKWLTAVDLWDKRKVFARELSGGMKRRLMIARALMHNPRLLILDEPTAGVDIEIRRSMWTFLRDLNAQGTTIILTTHYLEEAESLCRNIAIINDGKIIENTSMKELLSKLCQETFILDTKTIITVLPNMPFPIRVIDGFTLEVDVHKDHSINDVFSVLSDHQIEVLSLRNKTNRLEELFVRLTGNKR